jgi:MoaA/NifB/PqqE/SkfB family radical SAM enzyme
LASIRLSGRRIQVPPFPHHKYMISQTQRYFEHPDILNSLFMDNRILLTQLKMVRRHGVMVPRALLVDPTGDCNLHCTGCWAGGYGGKDSLSFETLDRIVREAEELGIKYVFFSGGEPLLRKDDIIRLCETHRSVSFSAYTNGTLIDAPFADKVARVENLNLSLSIDGFREQTDKRRGTGVFDKVVRAMDLLRERHVAFGFSACYHAGNADEVSGDAFLDFLREKGCWAGWMFTYVPVGRDADLSMVCRPEQREAVARRTADYTRRHGMTIIDFWNNGHQSGGCVGGGVGFAHINARGDVEPCAFSHWSDTNINRTSLVEALNSPLFRSYQSRQPFSRNPMRSCPLLDNPEAIAAIVKETGALSTEWTSPEQVGEFSAKMAPVAASWTPVAERLFHSLPIMIRLNFKSLYLFRKIRLSFLMRVRSSGLFRKRA